MGLNTSAMARAPLASTMASLRACLLPIVLGIALIVFMKLEYTVDMVMPGMEPRDLGFYYTTWVHRFLANHPSLNSIFAACNTAFVLLQMAYVLWTLFVDRRKRPSIAILFMYTLRAFLGYATQLPVPQDFLGSGLDFPVNNTSFFLFFSGDVAGSVIVCRDMKRTHRQDSGALVGYFNLLQSLRLLATRGHYTIDLAIGAGAGWACDLLAGKYEEIQEVKVFP
ncbi:hypothetical protein L7F22_063714 [Adiantum nelumboides]|nr:hypothetical protein [Adiantum nelumboides]